MDALLTNNMRRHAPTALYIDTEVFVRNGFRLDTEEFNILRNTFRKGGIRLLIPKMMERELKRKYQEHASKVAEDFTNYRQKHPIKNLVLGNFPTADKLSDKAYDELVRQWDEFKLHFTVEELPLVENLDAVVEQYLRVDPPFSTGKRKEFPDAFIISTLDKYHIEHKASIAVCSKDDGFNMACALRPYLAYYEKLDVYAKSFSPERKEKSFPIDPTRPIATETQLIATEDLTEIKSILGRGAHVTYVEIERVMNLIQSRGRNYEYFFRNAKDAMWIEHLEKHGILKRLPASTPASDGTMQFFYWFPIDYLVRTFNLAPVAVLDVLEKLPDTDNPSVLEGIFDVVLKSGSVDVFYRFASQLLAFVKIVSWHHDKIIELLNSPFFFKKKSDFEFSLLSAVVEFLPDPQSNKKLERRKENQEDYWATSLTPTPRFDYYDYEEILNKGVRPLAEREPFEVSRILVDAVSTMIRLQTHEVDDNTEKDGSEFWCRVLNGTGSSYPEPKETLVHALTFACEQVLQKSPDSIEMIDVSLRNQRYNVFKRIRQHLYALCPSERTKPWIRELILSHSDYDQWQHHYEFQKMIRSACEHFGAELLTASERATIFDAILGGPPKADFRGRDGEKFTEDRFQQRQRKFHQMQLRPFSSVLFGKYATCYSKLESQSEDSIADKDYFSVGEVVGGMVSYRSPKSPNELAHLDDEQLLTYINEWEEEHHDRLIEVNIHALAGAFGKVFKEKIMPNRDRLNFWLQNRDRVQRPTYVRAMVEEMKERVKDKKFDQLSQWLDFCEWVTSHSASKPQDEMRFGGESREDPNWNTARRTVCDFVETCLSQDVDAPISSRQHLAIILRDLCTQFDWYLDKDEPAIMSDHLTNAINTTRGRAIENLINFGLWVRGQDSESEVPEVTTTLEERFEQTKILPITLPEHAILGLHYYRIVYLSEEWARVHKSDIFPQNNFPAWSAAFTAVIRYSGPSGKIFETLKSEYEFALTNLAQWMLDPEKQGNAQNWVMDRLGQHLFSYYLWGMYSLNGADSLLKHFYQNTQDHPKYWENSFNHVGYSLKNTGAYLDEGLKNKIVKFFNWRLTVANAEELQGFANWLDAKCMSEEWRLDSCLQVLDVVGKVTRRFFAQVSTLKEMLEDHTGKVVECLAKMTDATSEDDYVYIGIDNDAAKAILKAGLASGDEETRKNAQRAQDNLLKRGRFNFVDLDE